MFRVYISYFDAPGFWGTTKKKHRDLVEKRLHMRHSMYIYYAKKQSACEKFSS